MRQNPAVQTANPSYSNKLASNYLPHDFSLPRLLGALFCCLILTGCPEYFLFKSDSDSDSPPASMPIGGLNDTGITRCGDYAFGGGSGNHQNNLDCAAVGATTSTDGTDADTDPVPAGQDAHFGRDAEFLAGTLTKTGDGAAGFDYSKICNDGSECPDVALLGPNPDDWACTRDNVTGLIWEVKVNDNSNLRHNGHSYTWFNSDATTNGGSAGTANGGSCSSAGNCDTEKFVNDVNTATLCGANDWRLPNATELLSIAHRGAVSPAIDTAWFPNTVNTFYWSSSPYANDANLAWLVNFGDGVVFAGFKNNVNFGNRVRLVRAGQ